MGEAHFELEVTERLTRLEEQLISIDKALTLAREQLETRLEGMNEFRQSLKDQATQFVTKAEHRFILDDIRELRESRAELRGKASQASVYIAWLLAVVSIFINLLWGK